MQFNIIFKTIFEYIHKEFRFVHTNTFCEYRKKLRASPRVHLVVVVCANYNLTLLFRISMMLFTPPSTRVHGGYMYSSILVASIIVFQHGYNISTLSQTIVIRITFLHSRIFKLKNIFSLSLSFHYHPQL